MIFSGVVQPHAIADKFVNHQRDEDGIKSHYARPHIKMSNLLSNRFIRPPELDSRCNASGLLCPEDLALATLSDSPQGEINGMAVNLVTDGKYRYAYSAEHCAMLEEHRFRGGEVPDLETGELFDVFESIQVLEIVPLDDPAEALDFPADWNACDPWRTDGSSFPRADAPGVELPIDVAAFYRRMQQAVDGLERP